MATLPIQRAIAETFASGTRWASRTCLTLLDQGLASGSNFLIGILFARWLAPADYGAYAVAFSLFLFAAGFHNALVLEPMSVIAPVSYRLRLSAYFNAALGLHVLFAAGLSLLFAFVAILIRSHNPPFARPFLTLAFAAPLILLFWMLRRACYVLLRPRLALSGSLAYLLAVLAVLYLGRARAWSSPSAPFAIMGLAGAAASLALFRTLRLTPRPPSRQLGVLLRETWRRHWTYGKFAVGVSTLHWLANCLYPPLIALCAGLGAAAGFRAADNLLLPMQHTAAALTLLLLPWVSSRIHELGWPYVPRFILKGLLVAASLAVSYVGILLLTGDVLLASLYGGAYNSVLPVLPLLGGALIVRAVCDIALATPLRASGCSVALLHSNIVGTLLTLTAGALLVGHLGILGAALAVLISNLAQTLVLALWLCRLNARAPAIA